MTTKASSSTKSPTRAPDPDNTPRTREGRWVAGGPSPNPGGRKSDRELTELARSRAPAAIDALARIAQGRGLAAVRAAEALLDRALGKPTASLNVTATRMTTMPAEFVGAAASALQAALDAEDSERMGDPPSAPNLESGSPLTLSPSENAAPALPGRVPSGSSTDGGEGAS